MSSGELDSTRVTFTVEPAPEIARRGRVDTGAGAGGLGFVRVVRTRVERRSGILNQVGGTNEVLQNVPRSCKNRKDV